MWTRTGSECCHDGKIILLLQIRIASCATAAADATLFYDSRAPQVTFAASEIRRAYAAAGQSLVESGLDRLAANASRVRIAVGPLNVSKPQSHSIRRQAKGANTIITVLGGDATGAVYGALDIAEANGPSPDLLHPKRGEDRLSC